MKAVLAQMAPGIAVLDLFADAPVGNPKASAYLLAAYAAWFPAGTVFLCVVDPGVGGRAYGKPPTFSTTDTTQLKRAIDMTDDELAAIVAKTRLTIVE
jgi:hypothetical protein